MGLALGDAVEDFSLACSAPEYRITLRMTNDTGSHQAWKMKTNAPQRWSVRPNGGVLNPGEAVDVAFKLCGVSMEGIESDRHLIINAPVAIAVAARLSEQRRQNPRASLDVPNLETPGVGQRRMTPVFTHLPPPQDLASPRAGSPSDAPAKPAVALASPLPATHTPAGLVSPAGGSTTPFTDAAAWPVDHRLSVTQRVAVLNRRYPSDVDGAARSGMVHAASSASVAEQEGEETEEEEEEDGDDDDAAADDEGKPRPRRRGRQGLLGLLMSLLSRGSEELVPWLSWKVFDVIFALAVLWLAKRVKFVREAKELDLI